MQLISNNYENMRQAIQQNIENKSLYQIQKLSFSNPE